MRAFSARPRDEPILTGCLPLAGIHELSSEVIVKNKLLCNAVPEFGNAEANPFGTDLGPLWCPSRTTYINYVQTVLQSRLAFLLFSSLPSSWAFPESQPRLRELGGESSSISTSIESSSRTELCTSSGEKDQAFMMESSPPVRRTLFCIYA